MEPVKVPQHLELEDQIAWGLSAVDLLHVALGGLLAWWLYLFLPAPAPMRIAAAVAVALLASILGAGRLGEMRLRGWGQILGAYLGRPRRRLYGGHR